MSKKFVITIACLALLSASLAACETMEGAGQDIQHAGQSLEDAANEEK